MTMNDTNENVTKNPALSGQRLIDAIFDIAYEKYEEIRKEQDDFEKNIKMEVHYITFIKPFYDALHEIAGVRSISVERFARTDGESGHWYVPMFIDANGTTRISTMPFPYKATALMKMMAAFTTMAGDEKIFHSNG